MRIGQTSFVVFASKLVTSVLGFLATLYFARTLGAEILGYYSVVIALVAWLKFAGTLGITEAIVKRVSEGKSPNEYFSAGVAATSIALVLLSLLIVIFGDRVDAYIGANVWYFLIPLLLTGLSVNIVRSTLNGTKKVHIAGLLTPVNLAVSSTIQIVLVFLNYDLQGLLLGFLVGEIAVVAVGARFIPVTFTKPSINHFKNLFDYAKYSWLSGLKMRAYNDVDIVVLSALVSPTLVGVYSVAWSLARFLTLFGTAVRNAIFPEISNADSFGEDEFIEQLTTDSIAFVGLFAIPGLLGGAVLSRRLLSIYGPEFVRGTTVLVLLIAATLIYSYQQQMMSVINAIDRPDVTFRINVVFLISNLVLNVVLVIRIGWLGAAVATVASVTLALVLAYRSLRSLIDFEIPVGELGRQLAAAALMTAIVIVIEKSIESTEVIQSNLLIVPGLVLIGAILYFSSLLTISPRFRQIVLKNMPEIDRH